MAAPTVQDQQAVVDSAIKSISHIATLPEITLRIIELVEDPTSTAQDLHAIIANDPALCSRILKVVNSAFYGLPRQIGSINRAIVLLGLNAVKNIAIAASLTKLFRGGELCPGFAARDLWVHSVAAASAGKLICDELKLGLPDEAFLAGLMHDIGIMVEMQAQRNGLIEVFEQIPINADGAPGANMLEIERNVLGADHQRFGAGLCEAWKFPKSFGFVAGHHHNPLELPDGSRTLAAVVFVADRIAGHGGYGFRADLPSFTISDDVADELRLTRDQIERVQTNLPQVYEEVEATFNA
ncbi:MAG TPA: HDOD domain-containing protein [Phycisphaerales bacterium]|nr:HDOD domain-containing protein [Phycisphaerales bacterium]HRQ76735.1 HDOD domain-containing protein [Phycisphaerales bacterium]